MLFADGLLSQAQHEDLQHGANHQHGGRPVDGLFAVAAPFGGEVGGDKGDDGEDFLHGYSGVSGVGTVRGGNRQRDDFLDACGSEYARGFVQGRAAGDDVIDEQQPLRQFATHSKGAADIAPSCGVGTQTRLWRSPRFGEDAFGDERYAKRLRGGVRRVERLVEATLTQALRRDGHGDDGIHGDGLRTQQAAGFVFEDAQCTAVGVVFAAQDDVAHFGGELPAHQQARKRRRASQAGAAGVVVVGNAIGAGRTMFADGRQAVGADIAEADHLRRAAGEATRTDEAGQPAGNHAAAICCSRMLCR